jgi:FG-GAP repeat
MPAAVDRGAGSPGAPAERDGAMLSVLARAAALAALFAATSAAQTKPGEVEAQLVLDANSPGLAGKLDPGDRFGRAVATVRDLDNDGHGDIVVGAPWDDDGGPDRGAVWILFLNGDGTIKSTSKISDTQGNFLGGLQNGNRFGNAVSYLGDLDQDGTGDIAVAAIGDDDGGSDTGAVWILFLFEDGTVERHQKISPLFGDFHVPLDPGDQLGRSVAGLPDIDGDGVFDMVVGANGDDNGGAGQGCVYVMNLTLVGKVKGITKISAIAGGFQGELLPGDRFGQSVTTIGDQDDDGVPDLLVGADLNDVESAGIDVGAAWLLHMNTDGTVKSEAEITNGASGFTGTLTTGDRFGVSVSPVGDVDGDAAVDAAVGCFLDDDGGSGTGSVWIVFLGEDGLVSGQQKISATEGHFTGALQPGDRFAMAGAVEDLNGDGTIELAVGAPGSDAFTGATWILFLHASEWVNLGHALPGTLGPPKLQGIGALVPDTEVLLTITQGKPLGDALLVLGTADISLPFFGGVLVPAPDIVVGPTHLDANGFATIHGRWPSGAPSGYTLWFQAWIPDPAGPEGFAATNALQVTSP